MNFESIVMNYLTAQGLFLSPQFSVIDTGGEWSCPDFVALDFRKHEIQVVEVTTAYDITRVIERILNREEQWFQRLKQQLVSRGIPVSDWQNVVRLFVRQDRRDYAEAKLMAVPDISVEVIENVAFSWKWPWEEWRAQPDVAGDAPQTTRS